MAWKSRWIILVCVLIGLAAGFIYVNKAIPMYQCTARLYLDYAGISINQSHESVARPRTDTYLFTQAELLTSRPILRVVVERPDVRSMQTFADVDIPMSFLKKNVRVDVGRRDDVISVSLRSPYPIEAAELVNHIVDAYLDSRSDHEQRNSARVMEMLKLEMVRASHELEGKRNELEEFQDKRMPLSLGSDEGSGVMPRYLELQATLTQAELATMEAESFLQAVESLAGDPDALREYMHANGQTAAYTGSSTQRVSVETRLREARSELEQLLEDCTPHHPRVLGLRTEIGRIEEELSVLDAAFIDAVQAAAVQACSRAAAYAADVNDLCRKQQERVMALNSELAKFDRLRTEVGQLTTYCLTIEQQIREIRTIVGEDVGQLRMQVLEPALPAEQPVSPQRNRVMATALLLGLFVGGGLGLLRDVLDQTLRSADEIAELLGLPVLGVVPQMSRRQKVPVRGRQVALQPDSHEAEAFRSIRTAIFFGSTEGQARTILVTSPAPGDGKSTVASNLAIAMAQASQRTIILDADVRKPTQHAIFDLDLRDCGLDRILEKRDMVQDAIQCVCVEGLSVLPCGRSIPNPAEIVNSAAFAELLEHLAQTYDRVIVDAPPVAVVTDAQILGALCDATVLVVRADRSTRRTTQKAVEALRHVGSCLVGVVINGTRESGTRYGYYRTYGKGNGPGHRSDPTAKTLKMRQANVRTQRVDALDSEGGS